jgi:hypothetical protein
LLLAEQGADFAHARRQGDLEVVGHHVLAGVDGALLLGLAHHAVDALDGLLAALEAPGDVLGEGLDLALLPLLDRLVVEAREHVLLVQLVELARVAGDICQVLCDVVLDVEPARRQQVHLDDGVAVVVEGGRGHEALALLVAEAGGHGAAIARGLVGRVVGVRLAVRDEAVAATSAHAADQEGRQEGAHRLVRSRHMVGWSVAGHWALCHGREPGAARLG